MPLDFRPISLQVTHFLVGLSIPNKLAFTESLLRKIKDKFDDEPILFPVPTEVPNDVIRITLRNTDSSRLLEISLSRADLKFNFKEDTSKIPFEELMDRSFAIAEKIYEFFLLEAHARIPRIGLVFNFLSEIEGVNAASLIKKSFLRKDVFPALKEVQIVGQEEIKVAEYRLNKIISIMSAINKEDSGKRGIIVGIDINTIKEEDYNLKKESLKEIIAGARKYIVGNKLPHSLFP